MKYLFIILRHAFIILLCMYDFVAINRINDKNRSLNLWIYVVSVQSSLSIFAQKYLHKCEDTFFILQNKYLCIYEDSFGVKILRDDCAHS